jgi:hypothetical protein
MPTRQSGYGETVTRLVAGVAVAFVLGAASAAAANGIHVSPNSGNPSTTFTVSFVVPARTGVMRTTRRTDEVTVSNPATASGCTASATQLAPAAPRGRLVHVAVHPTAGTRWCTGTFTGRVLELQTLKCPLRSLCPMDARLRTLGTFSFSVR